jgi:hypothetical protein
MQLWVHRLSVSAGGDPAGSIPDRSLDAHRVLREILKPSLNLVDERAGAREFLLKELFDHGRLRQGWGVPGLDLRKMSFHDNFVIAMRRYWDSIPEETLNSLKARPSFDDGELFGILEAAYREAEGRYKILTRMQRMARGDIVFLPNIPEEGIQFSIATISDAGYTFDERNGGPGAKLCEFDFGHRRNVSDVRSFKYSSATLPSSIFGSPYRHAIDRVSEKHEPTFTAFVSAHYRKGAAA